MPVSSSTTTRPVRACRSAPKKEIYKVDSDWEAIDDNDNGDYTDDDGWDLSDGISEVTIVTDSEEYSSDDEEGPRTKDGYLKDDFIASDSEADMAPSVLSDSEMSADSADFSDVSDVSLKKLIIESDEEESSDDDDDY